MSEDRLKKSCLFLDEIQARAVTTTNPSKDQELSIDECMVKSKV